MANHVNHEAAIPNPALQPFSILIGEWTVVAKHRLIPETLHGHASFEWLEGGAFLIMHSDVEEPGVPTTVAIIGSDDVKKECYMLSFDERGVSRKSGITLQDSIWKIWRNQQGFSQRFTGTISDDGNTINGVWELSEDDATWKQDLEQTYTRVE